MPEEKTKRVRAVVEEVSPEGKLKIEEDTKDTKRIEKRENH